MPATSHHDTDSLLTRAAEGDASAVAQLFDRQRSRLRKLIAIRIDTRIAARVDPSDVIQEALLDASQAMDQFLQERPLPFYPWLRQITLARLMQIHRFHLHTRCRTVQREVNLRVGDRSGQELVRHFVGQESNPAEHAERMENQRRVQDAITQLSALDRSEGVTICGPLGPAPARAVQKRSTGGGHAQASEHRQCALSRRGTGRALLCDGAD